MIHSTNGTMGVRSTLAERLIGPLHRRLVMSRRISVLAAEVASRLPEKANVLDIGAGSGEVGAKIASLAPGLNVVGIDVLLRPNAPIPVATFDGHSIPYPDDSFDYCLFIDVLHHVEDPTVLLSEAFRVSRMGVVIKDHCCQNFLDFLVLAVMDWVGNAPHGVVLPFRYLSRDRWREILTALGGSWREQRLHRGLYPPFANWLFGRHLQVIYLVNKVDG